MFRTLKLAVLTFLLVACSNTYYVEDYKPKSTIDSEKPHLLESRFTTVEYTGFNLHLEWLTYDNKVINKAPYKLYFVLEPKDSSFAKIEIVSVEIDSDKGKRYTFEKGMIPFSLSNNKTLERSWHILEPPFKFDFNGGEVVSTKIEIKVIYEESSETHFLEHEWHPIRVKHYAPVV